MKDRVLGNFFNLDFFDTGFSPPSEILSRECDELFLLSRLAMVGDWEYDDPLLTDPIDSVFRCRTDSFVSKH